MNPINKKYAVIVGNKIVTHLNSNLVRQQDISDEDLERIKAVHKLIHHIRNLAEENTNDLPILKFLSECNTDANFMLQKLWKFPLDAKFHMPWDFPGCTCPKMDNEDAYPTGNYVWATSCSIHGEKNESC